MQRMHLHYVIEFDIKGFFDNVDHSKLIRQIWAMGIHDKQLIYLIKQILKAPIKMPDGEMVFPTKGTPQGGIISPLLANIVLNELDWWVDSQFIARREIPIEAPAYCCSEQAGKPVAQRVESFNAGNAPFRLTDFKDGHYSLSLNISFLEPPYTNYGQKAFDAYAVQTGDPAKRNDMFVRGSGYDWESVFRKAKPTRENASEFIVR